MTRISRMDKNEEATKVTKVVYEKAVLFFYLCELCGFLSSYSRNSWTNFVKKWHSLAGNGRTVQFRPVQTFHNTATKGVTEKQVQNNPQAPNVYYFQAKNTKT